MSAANEASLVFEQLLAGFKEKFASSNQQQSALDAFKAFSAAVDWQEPWLIIALCAQTLLFFSVVVMHKNTAYLTGVFVLAMLLVYGSERLNKLLAQNWQSFARQPYFDKNGIFISAVLSAPLVLDMLVILVCYLLNLSRMLVQMKRQELRHKARQKARHGESPDTKKKA